MGNGTGDKTDRGSSAQRELVTAWLQEQTTLDPASAGVWAQACTVLLEAGWAQPARLLLAHLLGLAPARRAWAALAGGMVADTDEPPAGGGPAPAVEPPQRPRWAGASAWSGPGGTGQALYGREIFDLRAAAGPDRPHVRVLVYGTDTTPPAVLIEVSESGTPAQLEPAEAHRLAAAVTDAARLTDAARRGRA